MTGQRLLRRLPRTCRQARQEGSHVRIECGECRTTVPIHAGEDLPKGTLRAIERDLEPCLGRKWLRRPFRRDR
ncbi:MAG TPA: type II toxin-antitoxin system HicA family toxin [Candidatus Limnocylindria bacterium]